MRKSHRILFAGGGTLGSVTPLLAVQEALEQQAREGGDTIRFIWVGTVHGPERTLISSAATPFLPIYTGKLRRYFSWRNFSDPFFLCIGIVQSLGILIRFRPAAVVSAGGYVAVPVHFASWLLRIKSFSIQPDLLPGLANILTAFCVEKIFLSFDSVRHTFFSQKKRIVTGVPVRQMFTSLTDSEREKKSCAVRSRFAIPSHDTLVLVLGGGTGAAFLNSLTYMARATLPEEFHIIHLTGKGKSELAVPGKRYHPFSFLDEELPAMMAAADVVVTRGGMGALSELGVLGKACIVIPLPFSPQERNASFFKEQGAVVALSQQGLSVDRFSSILFSVRQEPARWEERKKCFHELFPLNASQTIATHIAPLL